MSTPKPSSNFSDLLASRKARKQADASSSSASAQTPLNDSSLEASKVEVDYTAAQNKEEEESKTKMGRPKGRRSNPDYTSLTLLVNEKLLVEARHKLDRMNMGQSPKITLSEVIDQLLEEWINRS